MQDVSAVASRHMYSCSDTCTFAQNSLQGLVREAEGGLVGTSNQLHVGRVGPQSRGVQPVCMVVFLKY